MTKPKAKRFRARVIKAGDLQEARRKIRKILKESGLSVNDILASLKEDRQFVYDEIYGHD